MLPIRLFLRRFAVLCALAASVIAVSCRPSSDAGSDAGAGRPGRTVKAPAFELTDLDGVTFSLADLKGEVVFLDFWATWCPPCVVSAPEVERLSNDFRSKGLTVVSISLDDSLPPVRQFVERFGLSSRVALSNDPQLSARYGVQGIPHFVLIDREGYVAGVWEGFRPDFGAIWRREVERLL